MNAKDEEMIKFLDENDEKQAKRKQSILARTIESEEIKNIVTGKYGSRFLVSKYYIALIFSTHCDMFQIFKRIYLIIT